MFSIYPVWEVLEVTAVGLFGCAVDSTSLNSFLNYPIACNLPVGGDGDG